MAAHVPPTTDARRQQLMLADYLAEYARANQWGMLEDGDLDELAANLVIDGWRNGHGTRKQPT